MHMQKHCLATKKINICCTWGCIKRGWVTRKRGAVAYKRGTVITLLFNLHVSTKDLEPTNGLKNLALKKKKTF